MSETSVRRSSRNSGYSNIFSGVNLAQLQRLFQTAGDKEAEHRARLLWRNEEDGGDEEHVKEAQGTEEEAGLARALVGLRICARTKAGLRAEAPTREHKWYSTSPYMQQVKGSVQNKESFSQDSVMDEDITTETNDSPLCAHKKYPGNSNLYHSSSWRLRVTQHVRARDSDQYLHRIL